MLRTHRALKYIPRPLKYSTQTVVYAPYTPGTEIQCTIHRLWFMLRTHRALKYNTQTVVHAPYTPGTEIQYTDCGSCSVHTGH